MRRRRRPASSAPLSVELTVRGEVGSAVRRYAEEKVIRVARFAPRPVLVARIILSEETNPSVQRRAVAEASLDVSGRAVRAHVAAAEMREAIDLLAERLRRRLDELAGFVEARRAETGIAASGEWRHGALPIARPEYFPRPAGERELVKHKTFADGVATPEEAVLDMRLLDHDFYLFTNAATGEDNVVYERADGGLGWAQPTPAADSPERYALELQLDPAPATRIDAAAAIGRLDASGEPFVFFVDPASERGNVVYRRYDGHYGLITSAEAEAETG